MKPISSSSSGTCEEAYASLSREKAGLGCAPREGSMEGEGMRWAYDAHLRPFSETNDPSIWGDSPVPPGARALRVLPSFEAPMIDSALTVRRVNRVRERCFNITLSGVSGLSVIGGSYGLYEIYEKTETDLKIVAFVPLCLLVVIGFGVAVYRGYLGCCRRV